MEISKYQALLPFTSQVLAQVTFFKCFLNEGEVKGNSIKRKISSTTKGKGRQEDLNKVIYKSSMSFSQKTFVQQTFD
jgi:hypothetical protein